MLSFMNFKGTVVNQMITPHNETRFLSDQLKKKQSQQKSVISQQLIPPPSPPDRLSYSLSGLRRTGPPMCPLRPAALGLFLRNCGFNMNVMQ